jgi:hypothetical protein
MRDREPSSDVALLTFLEIRVTIIAASAATL